jgi:hypothetical protein
MHDPFEHLDFEELIKPEHWRETSAIHTPTFEAQLSEAGQRLTFTFASGHQETIERGDIEALTRFLDQCANVAPLQVDEDVLKDIHPRRVDE